MKWILILQICLLSFSCCKKSENACADDEIAFGELDCIKKESYTFYRADVNFYCLDKSILLGLDIDKKEIAPYYINTYNPVNRPVLSINGNIKLQNCSYCGFNIECTINNVAKVVWVVIEDKNQFADYPNVLKAKLILKESIDFNSITLEEMDIELTKL